MEKRKEQRIFPPKDSRFELRMHGDTKQAAMDYAKKLGVSLAEFINGLLKSELNKHRVEA